MTTNGNGKNVDKEMVNKLILSRFSNIETGISDVRGDTTKILNCLSGIESWKKEHIKLNGEIAKKIKSHGDRLSGFDRIKNKVWGLVIAIPVLVTVVIKYILKG